MPGFGSTEPVSYEPGANIDTSRPLWIVQRLTLDEWARIAQFYPELGGLPENAFFRRIPVLITPPETRSSYAELEAVELAAAAFEQYSIIQECFASDSAPKEWVVVCRRGEGVGFITLTIYRSC